MDGFVALEIAGFQGQRPGTCFTTGSDLTSGKPKVDAKMPRFSLPKIGGGSVEFGAPKDRWTMLFVYRGKHCPRCKKFLNKLDAMLSDWTGIMDVAVISADSEEKAQADQAEFGWAFDL